MPKTKVAQAVADETLDQKLPEVVKEEAKVEPKEKPEKRKPVLFAHMTREYQFRVGPNEKIMFSGGFYSTDNQNLIDKLRRDRFYGGRVTMKDFADSVEKVKLMRTQGARFGRGSVLSAQQHYEIEG